ncbi:VOC family protein [Deinococcus aquatilis]|uniref:VOC family protein n=1 Tax=Deinococcus aquatilis TaxID=519440 RepID=UPI00036F85C9|nr:VOC family protein [Deinococcus aquatilis]
MTQPANARSLLTSSSLTLGPVELSVSDLNRTVSFYSTLLGMTVLDQTGQTATLGLPNHPLLVLTEHLGAQPTRPTSPGLYHLAVLLPTRADLARWVQHASHLGVRLGQSDHLVSEAFYLNDPDGHGIEVYRDRPRDEWRWQSGQVQMAGDPIDMDSLLSEPGAELPFAGLPEGTTLGHVHLRVTNLPLTEAFYSGLLGFDVVSRWPGALFISVGGYHHHFGLNTWQSQGGQRAPEQASQLQRVNVQLLDPADLDALETRLRAANIALIRESDVLDVRDPAGNALRFRSECLA